MTEWPITGHMTFYPICMLVCSLTDRSKSERKSRHPLTLEMFWFFFIFKFRAREGSLVTRTISEMSQFWHMLAQRTCGTAAFLFPPLPHTHTRRQTNTHGLNEEWGISHLVAWSSGLKFTFQRNLSCYGPLPTRGHTHTQRLWKGSD